MRASPGVLITVAALAGCTSFQDPDVVIDLRVLAMSADLPEQVVTIDPSRPPQPTELLAELVPATVCALVADPAFERRVRYQLTLCASGSRGRCDADLETPIGSGLLPDPELAPASLTRLCATVTPNGNLLGILLATVEGDPLSALGGIEYLVQLEVGGEDEDPAADLVGSKRLRVAPRIPVDRTANVNPTIDRVDATIAGGPPIEMPLGRCVDQVSPIEVAPGAELKLEPIEPPSARETYTVPTLDGRTQTFTESLTYQWLATAGSFSSGSTGGTRDGLGNEPLLFTEWRAPRAAELAGPTDVSLWWIQRDERLGLTWYESCVRVVP